MITFFIPDPVYHAGRIRELWLGMLNATGSDCPVCARLATRPWAERSQTQLSLGKAIRYLLRGKCFVASSYLHPTLRPHPAYLLRPPSVCAFTGQFGVPSVSSSWSLWVSELHLASLPGWERAQGTEVQGGENHCGSPSPGNMTGMKEGSRVQLRLGKAVVAHSWAANEPQAQD